MEKYMKNQQTEKTIRVHFTESTWQKIEPSIAKDPLKAEMVPYMPDIIATGQYLCRELYNARTDKTKIVHEYWKTIESSEGPRDVIVSVMDVSEHDNASEGSIEPFYEVVSLCFANEKE